jgi:hypothetical protein
MSYDLLCDLLYMALLILADGQGLQVTNAASENQASICRTWTSPAMKEFLFDG